MEVTKTSPVGVLALPAAERNECQDSIEVRGKTITRHERHVCLKNFPHAEHRCWTCTVVWCTPPA